jgi:hypothetical protein
MGEAFPLPAPALIGGAPLYLTGEDAIRLTAFNAAANVRLALRGRFLPVQQSAHEPPSTVGVFESELVPTTDRLATLRTTPLGEGWLLDWSLVAVAGTPKIGQCFAVVSLVRGGAGATIDFATLGQGYVTNVRRLGGPGVSLQSGSPFDGAGVLRSFAGTNPAAGAEISETVPTGARWRFISLRATLGTDATVANRAPVLTFDDGATAYAGAAGNFNQAASLSFVYHFGAVGVNHVQTSVAAMVSTPGNLVLPAGHRIRTITGGIQVTDDWSAPQLLVEEWMEP